MQLNPKVVDSLRGIAIAGSRTTTTVMTTSNIIKMTFNIRITKPTPTVATGGSAPVVR